MEPDSQLKARNGPVKFATQVPMCSATQSRPPAVEAYSFIDKPSIPRANLAVSAEKPHGEPEYAAKHRDYTVLQQHVLFWDRDNDGKIYPSDTYIGFRDLGFNIVFCLFAAFFIHFGFSYPTRLAYSFIPDPFFAIYVGGIHKAKHGSDSGVYDSEGRFVPQKFEDLFSKWDGTGDNALGAWELFLLMHGNRVAMDPFGWTAAFFEWGTTWLLLKQDGRVHKEDLRGCYDGSIFWKIREDRQTGRVRGDERYGSYRDAVVIGSKVDGH